MLLVDLVKSINDPVFIVGGGPSLRGVDLSPLKGKCVFGVNYDMFRPEVTVGVFGDLLFYRNYKYDIQAMHVPVIALTPDAKKDFPYLYYCEKRVSPSLALGDRVAWGLPNNSLAGNTGAAALNIAVNLGAEEIVLIGFDLKETNGRRNHHDAYAKMEQDIVSPYPGFIQRFESFAPKLEESGVRVYNASMESALECFPKRQLKEFL